MNDVYVGSRSVAVGGVRLAVTDHGPIDGTPVLLVHGFPDSAHLWRNQIPVLAAAGHRVIAPDLRGFGRSDKPRDVRAYGLEVIASDLLAILDDAGVESAHIVGHDWGAAISWYLAMVAAPRVRSLTALSVGHPAAFRAAGLPQREKSWYMLLFQFVDVAEAWLSNDDWANLREWTGSPSEIEHWIEDLSRDKALTAALSIYRANIPPESLIAPLPRLPKIAPDVMGVWSSGDIALLEPQMTGSAAHVAGEWRYERIEGASHWIPIDAADEINALLLDWLGNGSGSREVP